ncbi:MarR family transcriptional regulator [Alkalihalobacillus alcalophilus ATCC 27647 = CGMCC 1.3604]|uniref:MarR family transcriptional regulator n=1 Tax=Alkalihalobacillus alcalophilus ATCC 27647 = CGMCC 1.3604 TaxID=1218173 RepID=A0A094WIW8_ALKAL|nr:MarR family transcriptional regulator [Alkalihalobacillus alcalophilus]KGA96751.1 MarR family transcriptional regulator [Alkalihalobacillus alcalophilus ATCC 27647 = CGMCC 1.3604]MED1563825.1 MarR family transcriptional regulator [Alkalihalobacillus alcalophilus]THG92130.1 MarR family transcriptional regulator [Alkalihalobacillus alcalophilus ATCC 27647 = CGMCC 1.3604]
MSSISNNQMITNWLSFTNLQTKITNELERTLQENHQLSLKEFYVLLFLSETPEKKLRLQELQNMVGLSQSAMSRLVSRFEEKGCGALKRHICIDDRRAIYTSLTEEGEKKLELASVTLNRALENIFSDVAINEELKKYIELFNR